MREHSHTSTGTTERQQYDFEETAPAMAVVQTLADATGEQPTEIESLFDHVDPDALNSLLRSSNSSNPDEPTTVSFTVSDRHVNVGCDGFIVVTSTD